MSRHRRINAPAPKSTWNRRRSAAASVVAVSVASIGVYGAFASAMSPAPSTSNTTQIASDSYHRTVASGLGRADQGGAYTTYGQGRYTVSAGRAQMAALAPGQSAHAVLASVSAVSTEVEDSITVPSVTAAKRGLYYGLEARWQDNSSGYRTKVTLDERGRVAVRLTRVVKNVETDVASTTTATALSSGETLNLRLRVTGTAPVVVQSRAWRDGTAEPGWQLRYDDTSAVAIKTAGAVGTWAYVSSSGVTTAFSQSNLRAWHIYTPTAATKPTPTPTTQPTPTTKPVPTTKPLPTLTNATPTPTKSTPTPTRTTPVPTPTNPTPVTPVTTGRGSAGVGQAAYSVPVGAIFVSPSGSDSANGSQSAPLRTVAKAIANASAGRTIVLRAGTYHESLTVTKAGLTIQAYPKEAVWFDGSSAVTSWTQRGTTWVHSGWTTKFDHSASFTYGKTDSFPFVNSTSPMAAWPDEMFYDGIQLRQVGSVGQVTAGKFYVDYGAQTLTIADNPSGHAVRSSDLIQAFNVQSVGVTLQGFGVHRYATPLPALGAIRLVGGSDTARDLVISDNATQGLSLRGSGNIVDHVTASHNGMTGIHGNEADDLTIRNTLVTDSNSENFNTSPSAAGIKLTRSVGITIDNVQSSDNNANGIWLDESIRRFSITNSSVLRNHIGLQLELSDTGIVANNEVDGAKYDIYIFDTGNVKVFNNYLANAKVGAVFVSQDQRRQAAAGAVGRDPRMPVPDASCPWLVRNLTIANNDFPKPAASSSWQVYALDKRTGIPADRMNITVNGNRFSHRDTAAQPHMVGWGGDNNVSLSVYETPAALNAAKAKAWTNLQLVAGGALTQSIPSKVNKAAVPLPADVAGVVGVSAGMQVIGLL